MQKNVKKGISQVDRRKKVVKPTERKELSEHTVISYPLSIKKVCNMMSISESCYRYSSNNMSGNDIIVNFLLKLLDDKHKSRWGFGLYFDHIRNVKCYKWNHKRVYRIYCELALKL